MARQGTREHATGSGGSAGKGSVADGQRWHRAAAEKGVENQGSAVAADAGPAGARLPEVEA